MTIISGDTGIDKITDGSVVQADLASGVAGTGPAFHAYNAGTQSISAATNTKVVFNAELFDTNSCFDTSTYRFTPNVAGYYQINVGVYYQGTNNAFITLRKNGTELVRFAQLANVSYALLSGSSIAYMNGTTDYLEIYAYDGGGQTLGASSSILMFFNGFLARAA